jgi:hypothetical protein
MRKLLCFMLVLGLLLQLCTAGAFAQEKNAAADYAKSGISKGTVYPEKGIAKGPYMKKPDMRKAEAKKWPLPDYGRQLPGNMKHAVGAGSGNQELQVQVAAGTDSIGADTQTVETQGLLEEGNELQVSVDKTMIQTDVKTEVVVSLVSGGSPAIGQPVVLRTWYGEELARGISDEKGQFRAVLVPDFIGNVVITAGDREYSTLLYALTPEFGLVDITAVDRQGQPLENFEASVKSLQTWQGAGVVNKTVRVLAYQGENLLALHNTWDGSRESYVVFQNIQVQPGIINQILVDTRETTEVTMKFSFDGEPLGGVEALLERSDSPIAGMTCYIGATDAAGSRTLYVSAGTYKAGVQGYNTQGEFMRLYQPGLLFGDGAATTHECAWSRQNVGKLRLLMHDSVPVDTTKWLWVENGGIAVLRENEILLNPGEYPVDGVTVEQPDSEGNWIHYEYWKPSGRDILQIAPGQEFEYDMDLSIQTVALWMENPKPSLGNTVNFGVDIKTPSGFKLNWCNGSSMDITVDKPDGSVMQLSEGDFRQSSFRLGDNDPYGVYTIKAQVHLEPWYGTVTAAGTFEIEPVLEVSADKLLIRAQEYSTVTVAAKRGGIPAAGEPVLLRMGDVVLAEGVTNEQGLFTATIKTPYDGELVIVIDGREYRELLYAAWPDQGLAEISAVDKNGAPLQGFVVSFARGSDNWGFYTEGKVARTLLYQGDWMVRVMSGAHGDREGYFLVKTISVIPGEVNTLNMDGRNTVAADFNLLYQGTAITNGELLLDKTDESGKGWGEILGYLEDAGMPRVNVTPGTYKVGVSAESPANESLYLTRENISIQADGAVDVAWSAADTGKLRINCTDPLNNVYRAGYILNGWSVVLPAGGEVVVSAVKHSFDWIWMSEFTDEGEISYGFSTPAETRIVNVEAGKTAYYDFSLAIRDISLKMYTDRVQPEMEVHYGVEAVTETGHILEGTSRYSSMDVTVTRPDGQQINLQQYFRNGYFWMEPGSPQGIYTVDAKVNLGPRYGYHEVTTHFMYAERLTITGSDPMSGSIGIPVDKSITILYNKEIRFTAGDKKEDLQISLLKSTGGTVQVNLAIQGNTLVITPKSKLQENLTYILFVPEGLITDKEGQTTDQDYVMYFKTVLEKKKGK